MLKFKVTKVGTGEIVGYVNANDFLDAMIETEKNFPGYESLGIELIV